MAIAVAPDPASCDQIVFGRDETSEKPLNEPRERHQ
jgi:hypothetical protein